jgi:hypothetical protein
MHKIVAYRLPIPRRSSKMKERWAVAYGACDTPQGEFLWLRSQGGEIVIFASKQAAVDWVDARISFIPGEDDVHYIKLPPAKSC